MKKILFDILLLVACLGMFVGCTNTAHSNNNKNDNVINESDENDGIINEHNTLDGVTNESIVLNLFLKYAYHDSDGTYRFRDYKTLNNCSFLYNFVYSPSLKLYNSSVLVTSYTNPKLYDYASITFSWGDFKNGLFYAYHELDSIARIEFEYKNLSFYNFNRLGENYSYRVTSNSFVNLNNQADIDEYAATAYGWVQQVTLYLNSLFYDYNESINLY